jgi:hypothetical protein
MSQPQSSASTSDTAPRRQPCRWDRHHRLVLSAEIRRIASELYSAGPMPRALLSRKCQPGRWSEGSFEAAVQEGVRQGKLRRLPFDFIDVERSATSAVSGSLPRRATRR